MDSKTLFENKKEYLQYLQDSLVEPFIAEFQAIYDTVQKSTSSGRLLKEFQASVSKIAEWNHVMIASLYERVLDACKCEFMHDLVRAIFVTYVRFNLASHGKLDSINKIKIRVPNAENFIHKCLISCARVAWQQPYLFYHGVRSVERQHNRSQIDEAFRKAIATTVRNSIPWDQLFSITVANNSFAESGNASQSDEEDDRYNTNDEEESYDEESDDENGSNDGSSDDANEMDNGDDDVVEETDEEDESDEEDNDDDEKSHSDNNNENITDEDAKTNGIEEHSFVINMDAQDKQGPDEPNIDDDEKQTHNVASDNDDIVQLTEEDIQHIQEGADPVHYAHIEETEVPAVATDAPLPSAIPEVGDGNNKRVVILSKRIHKPKLLHKPRSTDAFF